MKATRIDKIKKLVELGRIVQKLKKEGKKIVLCHGVFDLLHPGHIRHFQSAKKYGDILIVTITSDKFVKRGPGRPIFKEELRSEVLAAIAIIDYVGIVVAESAVDAIKKIKPDFYVKGPDYRNRKQNILIPRKLGEEEEAMKRIGGKLVYTSDQVVFSSSRLINTYLDVYPPKTKEYLESLKRKYTSEQIIEKLTQTNQLNVLVIGDAIIDQYHYCLPLGKSSKEPVMVHGYRGDESFAGGSLMTANHIASLCNRVSLATVLGKKRSMRPFIIKHLKKSVTPAFFYEKKMSTIVKRRYVDAFTRQKLFQISYLLDFEIDKNLELDIIKYLRTEIKKYDLVVVNDFGHGMITDKIIRLVCRNAAYLALNVQANSANYGFNIITKYKRADFICIDEQEIRLATHAKHSDLKSLVRKVGRILKCPNIIVTKGPEGSINYSEGAGFSQTPSLTQNIVDRVGAGDALFAYSSICQFSKMDIELVAFVGNVAGALHIQTVGNKKPVELVDMEKFITRLLK